MRTIKENLLNRIVIQAKEADTRGLTKLAEVLTDQCEKQSSNVRADDQFYSYSKDEFEKDISACLWSAIIRTADFYNIRRFNADEMNDIVEKTAAEFVKEVRVNAGINHGVGAYEPAVPGERVEKASIEVDE